MTQKETILRSLIDRGSVGVCGTEFLDMHIPRYSARIHELKADGYTITTRRCDITTHRHLSGQTAFVYTPTPQGHQLTIGDA